MIVPVHFACAVWVCLCNLGVSGGQVFVIGVVGVEHRASHDRVGARERATVPAAAACAN